MEADIDDSIKRKRFRVLLNYYKKKKISVTAHTKKGNHGNDKQKRCGLSDFLKVFKVGAHDNRCRQTSRFWQP